MKYFILLLTVIGIFFAYIFIETKIGLISRLGIDNSFANDIYDNTYYPLFRLISKSPLPVEKIIIK